MTIGALTLGYAGCVVRVEASDASAVGWLREFLGPDIEEYPEGTPGHEVALHTDVEAFEELRRRGPHPSAESIGCFALDGAVVALPLWDTRADEVLVFDAELRTFFRRSRALSVDGRTVNGGRFWRTDLIAAPGNAAVRVALLRAVREVVSVHVVAEGGLLVHGASLALHGRGYVIAGPKGAGKTTLLLHLLQGTGAAYVSNDRAVLCAGSDPPMLRGMPTIVSIRASSLARFPDLDARCRRSGYHHRFTLDEAARAQPPASADGAGSSDLTPAQLACLLGAGRSGAVPLAALIFPRHTAAPGGATIEPLHPEIAAQRLRAALFRADSSAPVGEFFTDGMPAPFRDRRDAMSAALGARIPGFECALGPDAYEGRGSAARLLAAIEQLAARVGLDSR